MIAMAISLIAIVVAVVSVILSMSSFTPPPFVGPVVPSTPLPFLSVIPMLSSTPMTSSWPVYDPAYVAQQWTRDMTPAQVQQLIIELQRR